MESLAVAPHPLQDPNRLGGSGKLPYQKVGAIDRNRLGGSGEPPLPKRCGS